MKKFFTFAAAMLMAVGMWAETESNPTEVPSKDNAIVGVSYTIAGTYNAGASGSKIDPMPDKGVKFRTNKSSGTLTNAIEFTVNQGHVINGITLIGVTNTNGKAATLGSIYVDGEAWNGTFETTLAAKDASTASTIEISGIAAEQSVVFVFSNLNGTSQALLCYTVTYDEGTPKTPVDTVETLTAATINGYPLAQADFTKLSTEHTLTLTDSSYVIAPVVKFNKHIVITYDDQSTKEKDEEIAVTSEPAAGSMWGASVVIAGTTYSVYTTKATSYTVTYLYGTDTLGTEVVAAGGHPAEYAKYEKKALSLFGGWYSDAALTEAVQINEEVINSDKTYYAKFTVAYAKSINIEQLVLDNGVKFDIATAMADAGYDLKDSKGGLDSLNDDKAERNEPYLGLKLKKTGDYIRFNLKNGDALAVKIGHIEDSIMVISEGDTAYISKEIHEIRMTADNGDDFVQIITTTDKTLVFKQIMINKDFDTVILPAQTKFEASVSKAIEHGTVTLGKDKKSSVFVNEGDSVIINVTPDEGYKVGAVTAGNAIVLPVEGVYAFVMPGQNTEVSAEFILADDSTYIVTISESITNGWVVPDKYQAKAGDTITLTITPAEGYELEAISLEGIDLAIIVNGNTATFVMPKQNVTVLATFKAKTQTLYTVTLGTYEHGTVAIIEPNAENKYAEGAEVRLSVTPDEGYEVEAISLEGIDLAIPVVDGVASFNMPAQDVVVLATFKEASQGFENTQAGAKAVKVMRDGKLFIEKNGVLYNAQGVIVK